MYTPNGIDQIAKMEWIELDECNERGDAKGRKKILSIKLKVMRPAKQ